MLSDLVGEPTYSWWDSSCGCEFLLVHLVNPFGHKQWKVGNTKGDLRFKIIVDQPLRNNNCTTNRMLRTLSCGEVALRILD